MTTPTRITRLAQLRFPEKAALTPDPVTSVAGKTGAVTLEAADIASGTFADARITESSVTQHLGAYAPTSSIRAVTASDTVESAEQIICANTSPITLTLASGLAWCVVMRSAQSTAGVTVVSVDAPSVSIGGDASGVVLNRRPSMAMVVTDPGDSSNYSVVAIQSLDAI